MTEPGPYLPRVQEAYWVDASILHPADGKAERPVLVVQLQEDATFTKQDMIDLFTEQVSKWSIPDELIVVDELPHTATGKLLKTAIRKLIQEDLDRLAAQNKAI